MKHGFRRMAAACAFVVLAAMVGVGVSSGTANATGTQPIQKIRNMLDYSLNMGQNEGTFAAGAQAQIWYNRRWDHNDRWLVIDQYDGWFRYKNMYSERCLAATSLAQDAPVVQDYCHNDDPRQSWRFDASLAYAYGHMPVRNKWLSQYSSTPMVLTQQNNWTGSHVVTRAWDFGADQYWDSDWCGTRGGYPDFHVDMPEYC